MTIRTNTPNLLDNPPIPVQAKLAAAWTSFMGRAVVAVEHRPGQDCRGWSAIGVDLVQRIATLQTYHLWNQISSLKTY